MRHIYQHLFILLILLFLIWILTHFSPIFSRIVRLLSLLRFSFIFKNAHHRFLYLQMGCFCSKPIIEDDKVNRIKPSSEKPKMEEACTKNQETIDCKKEIVSNSPQQKTAHTFTYAELATATNNFESDCLLGEGGFGRVYKGKLESTGQVVAIKRLNLNGHQGNREFFVEVLMLSMLHHPNLVNLIGCCAEGEQRLLVYEYMPLGSLEDHLYGLSADKRQLDWITRMKIATCAAKGLEYLHDKANPPVIYRDLKCSNILLGEGYHAKLSDFGLAKLGPVGDKTHVSTRVMGTYGYCAPEYAMTGQLTIKSDIYSFGVVLLEIITGRRAIDDSRIRGEQNLVAWARPLFKDRNKFPQMADPSLQGNFPRRGLYQALAVAAMCVQEDPNIRPQIADVVTALTYLSTQIPSSDSHKSHHPNSGYERSSSRSRRSQLN